MDSSNVEETTSGADYRRSRLQAEQTTGGADYERSRLQAEQKTKANSSVSKNVILN
jgi:hypothetical protein